MASDASQSAPKTSSEIPPLQTRKRNGREQWITPQRLQNFMWTYPTAEVTARYFDVGIQPLIRYIKRYWGLTFDEFRDKNMSHTKNLLAQKAIDMALNKDNIAALIFCLKNINGWSDSISVQPGSMSSIQLRYSLDTPPTPQPTRDVTPEPENAA
jgi:hypothetical protein